MMLRTTYKVFAAYYDLEKRKSSVVRAACRVLIKMLSFIAFCSFSPFSKVSLSVSVRLEARGVKRSLGVGTMEKKTSSKKHSFGSYAVEYLSQFQSRKESCLSETSTSDFMEAFGCYVENTYIPKGVH